MANYRIYSGLSWALQAVSISQLSVMSRIVRFRVILQLARSRFNRNDVGDTNDGFLYVPMPFGVPCRVVTILISAARLSHDEK